MNTLKYANRAKNIKTRVMIFLALFAYLSVFTVKKYANRAKNIKTRVMPNKKMVYLHISAYKNIITDLRD